MMLLSIGAIILTILFCFSFSLYTKYQFIDGRKGKWHSFGWAMRVLFFLTISYTSFFAIPLKFILIGAIIDLPLFDILINKLALKQRWDYVGSTSVWDRKIGIWKWYIYLLLIFFIPAILRFL